MKFKVYMKDPDTLHDAIAEAVAETVADIDDEDERDAVAEVRRKRCQAIAAQWFKYSEYLMVEVDTDTETCTVLPAQ